MAIKRTAPTKQTDPLLAAVMLMVGLMVGCGLGFVTYLFFSVIFFGASGCPQTYPCL